MIAGFYILNEELIALILFGYKDCENNE